MEALLAHGAGGYSVITERIIDFLDNSSIRNARLVCKAWRNTIQCQKKWWAILLKGLTKKKIIFTLHQFDQRDSVTKTQTLEEAFPEYHSIIQNILADKKNKMRQMFRSMYPYFLKTQTSSSLMCPLLYSEVSMTCQPGSMLDDMLSALNSARVIKFACTASLSFVKHVFTSKGIEKNIYFEEDEQTLSYSIIHCGGNNLYHFASQSEDPRVIQYIIETIGMEGIDARNQWGVTPLLAACFGGSIETVKFLIKHANYLSIDVSARCEDGNNIYSMAAENEKSPNLLQILIETPEVRNSVALEEITETGGTVLHIACEAGPREAVEYLLLHSEEFGLDVNGRDFEGDSPILHACYSNREEIVSLFFDPRIAHKIRYNRVNEFRRNIFHMTCLGKGAKPAVMKLLLKHSDQFTFSLRGKDSYGCIPLHYACQNGHEEMAELILSSFQDPTSLLKMRNHDNNRPGDLARIHGHSRLESVLNRY